MKLIRTSIRNKLLSLMLISVTIPMITSTVMNYVYTKNSLSALLIEENVNLIAQGNINLTNYFNKINSASLSVYTDANINRILSRGSINDYTEESNLRSSMQAMFKFEPSIYQVFVSIGARGNFLNNSYTFVQSRWEFIYPLPPGSRTPRPFIEPPHVSHSYGSPSSFTNSTERVFTLHRPLYHVPNPTVVGWLSLDITLDTLEEICSQLYNSTKDDFYIVNSSGTAIYSSDNREQLDQELKNYWTTNSNSYNEENSTSILHVNDADFSGLVIVSKLQTGLGDLIIFKRIPDRVLYEKSNTLAQINSLINIIFLVLASVFVMVFSINIINPIKKLIKHIIRIEAGSLNNLIHFDRQDEIGLLGRKFQNMMNTINNLYIRQYEQEIVNTKTQLKLLQAQINPHFLNNALQSIGNIALDKGEYKVYSLISSLGQMMHYVMNIKDIIVDLEEEIAYVKNNLVLQQQRFEEKLCIEVHMAEKTRHIKVPKMILQPVVENYFKHGFDGVSKDNRLAIRTAIDNNTLIIMVEDNGIGMTEEKLRQLHHDMLAASQILEERNKHIGLPNVQRRLQLYFGTDAHIEFENLQPRGLKVTLIIPAERNAEHENLDR